MKLSLNFYKLNSVASITAGIARMTEDLRKLIVHKEAEIEKARTAIIEHQDSLYAARAEIEKAQNVIKNISALIEEKHE